ncbi:MAG: SMC-Scp complex subunit ScpB [Chloroflexi bacterium]|nr:SMC-Scp complex subunit ScpB [Chloroflexota bacterium]
MNVQVSATPPDKPELKTLVEAFILVSDGPVSLETLAQALQQDLVTIEFVVAELEGDYAMRGIRLQKMRDRVQFVTAPEVSEYVQKYLGLDTAPRLSPAALETLAIIAYRQPITRPQIEAIRGVNCDAVVHTLLARNLIEAVGELETVGHPTIYGTTFDFLQYFGLTNLEQLPPLPDNMMPVLPAILGNGAIEKETAEPTRTIGTDVSAGGSMGIESNVVESVVAEAEAVTAEAVNGSDSVIERTGVAQDVGTLDA